MSRESLVIRRAHSDQEGGITILDSLFARNLIRLTTTQGHDPKANGTAERLNGTLVAAARKSLLWIHDYPTRAALWKGCMEYMAVVQTRRDNDLTTLQETLVPFGALVDFHPPLAAQKKERTQLL